MYSRRVRLRDLDLPWTFPAIHLLECGQVVSSASWYHAFHSLLSDLTLSEHLRLLRVREVALPLVDQLQVMLRPFLVRGQTVPSVAHPTIGDAAVPGACLPCC